MRISDWSSDVCSSDLPSAGRPAHARRLYREPMTAPAQPPHDSCTIRSVGTRSERISSSGTELRSFETSSRPAMPVFRSEEHTSELQSLMRISYAVFCLKKKNNKIRRPTTNDYHK